MGFWKRQTPIVWITIFTVVETVWIVWLFPSLLQESLYKQVGGFLILETEHVIAWFVGARFPGFASLWKPVGEMLP